MHSNTICIVGLAFGHEIITKGKRCVSVVFGVALRLLFNRRKERTTAT